VKTWQDIDIALSPPHFPPIFGFGITIFPFFSVSIQIHFVLYFISDPWVAEFKGGPKYHNAGLRSGNRTKKGKTCEKNGTKSGEMSTDVHFFLMQELPILFHLNK
jgi:hypothetical protein